MPTLAERTLEHLWLPCTEMANYDPSRLLEVVSAKGAWLKLADGREVVDGISSWWCKTLGHGEPRLTAALVEQAKKLEHVILANATNETIAALTAKLGELAPGCPKVFYGGDGSTGVEIALKLCLHAMRLRGERGRTKFAALQGGYHGESQGCLAVSDQELYGAGNFEGLPRAVKLGPLPFVAGREDPAWRDCGSAWPPIERALEKVGHELCAVVVEPVLQGANGMRLHSPDLVRRLRAFCREHGVYFVADEILTGFYRVGKKLALEHAETSADIVVVSKGLTGGYLPLSAALVSEAIFDLCKGGRNREPFLHSNTYCGNALAAAVALAALEVYDETPMEALAGALEAKLRAAFARIGAKTGRLRNVRARGGVVAAEVDGPEGSGARIGRHMLASGALVRPLGNTIYWLPPINVDDRALARLEEATTAAIEGLDR